MGFLTFGIGHGQTSRGAVIEPKDGMEGASVAPVCAQWGPGVPTAAGGESSIRRAAA
ncbi:hypothetical protein ALSL_2629 [Aerosticca soli]|uniref:Uncharacterized protein n=1 Tax=Aerosticca soli TaxID=2010829 RepID=A0A2Z6E7Z3_9GAMM|nr:hypothetical protein ALSL_2629 [Aerosticca soli]